MGFSEFIKKMVLAKQIDFKEGRFEMLGKRGAILPDTLVTGMLEESYVENGDAMFEVLFEAGRRHGKRLITQQRKEGMSKRALFEEYANSANVMGLGKMEATYRRETDTLQLTVNDSLFAECFEQSDMADEIDRPVDELIRGMAHGAVEAMTDGPVSSTEETCEFLGDDHCVIRVQLTDS